MSRTHRLLAIAAAVALTGAACSDDTDPDEAVEETSEAAEEVVATETDEDVAGEATEAGTIVDVAAAEGSFTTLVAAVEAAGLVETLSGDGPFTVFAPTDAAFEAALAELGMSAEELLADTELLTSVLTYHVLEGEVPSTEVVTLDGQSVATVNGAEVSISVDGDTVMVEGATVTAVDVVASNGVIHVIDTVLLPPAG